MSFNIFSKSQTILATVSSLAEAMEKAKAYNEFVIISDGIIEIGGVFGVDSIKDGKTPDGEEHTWNKSERIGKMRRKDTLRPSTDALTDEDWDD